MCGDHRPCLALGILGPPALCGPLTQSLLLSPPARWPCSRWQTPCLSNWKPQRKWCPCLLPSVGPLPPNSLLPWVSSCRLSLGGISGPSAPFFAMGHAGAFLLTSDNSEPYFPRKWPRRSWGGGMRERPHPRACNWKPLPLEITPLSGEPVLAPAPGGKPFVGLKANVA